MILAVRHALFSGSPRSVRLRLGAQGGVSSFEIANAWFAWIGVHALLPTPQCQAVSSIVCAMETERASKQVFDKISNGAR